MIRVAIMGATGYTGSECIRLLQYHSEVSLKHLFSTQHHGNSTIPFFGQSSAIPETFDIFDPEANYEIDCLLCAVPHGAVHPIMKQCWEKPYKIVDLTADFRLHDEPLFNKTYNTTHSCPDYLTQVPYGLPELYAKDIAQATRVANPGCYAATTILALHPMKDVIEHVVIDAKSGVSGAGKSLKETSLYCEVNEHTSAYGTNVHRHQAELAEHLGVSLVFSPHLVPQSRGILVSCYATLTESTTTAELIARYQVAYKNQPFITIKGPEHTPSTQHVVGSNMCEITIKSVTEKQVILFAATDNLIKGAAGQAIQNMNLMFGLKPEIGLPVIATRV